MTNRRRSRKRPVSYTHLDVYKRQVQVLAKVPAFLEEAKFLYGRMLEEIPR